MATVQRATCDFARSEHRAGFGHSRSFKDFRLKVPTLLSAAGQKSARSNVQDSLDARYKFLGDLSDHAPPRMIQGFDCVALISALGEVLQRIN